MFDLKLEATNYLELAELLEITGIELISFSPAEIKSLFDLKNPATDLSDFHWNIPAAIIKGKVKDQITIFPPAKLISNYLESVHWHPLAVTAATISFICSHLTVTEFLEKLQDLIADKFEFLSYGQAKSVIKRFVGSSLTSSERNDISKIKQKINSCKKMISTFDGMLSKRELDIAIRQWKNYHSKNLGSLNEIIEQSHLQLKFLCFECHTYFEFPSSHEPIIPPTHHGKPMVLTWGARLSGREAQDGFDELKNAISTSYLKPIKNKRKIISQSKDNLRLNLYCTVCDEFFDLSHELARQIMDSDKKVPMPFHHEKEMEIRVGEKITDKEKLERIKEISKVISSEKSATCFFMCLECKSVLEFDDDLEYQPKHHGKPMSRIWLER